MFHLDNNSGVSAMPPLGAVQNSSPRWFTEGGGGVPASYPGAAWFNMIQAELLNLCAAYGITPDKANLNQLKLAIEAAVNQRAPLASPAFTGVPTAPTAGQSTNNTQIATTAFVKTALAALVDSSPAALDTLNELAEALGNDPNFATTMTNALAGKQPLDNTLTALSGKDVAGILSYLQLRESFSGVVGTSRNSKMSVTAAASTATFTADELIVETATGQQYRLSAFNKAVNLGVAGAGGMDAGSVPAAGFIALYAIFNPTNGAAALLAVDATNSIMQDVYSGASMPAGYTASALVSVWRISGSQFVAGYQTGRSVSFPRQTALTSTSQVTSLTALSIAGIVPKNATEIGGYGSLYSTAATGGLIIDVASGASGAGIISIGGYVGNTGLGVYGQFSSLALVTPQTMYYDINPNGSVVQAWSASIVISRYSI